jgi:predicted O-methyltransferase YrrM
MEWDIYAEIRKVMDNGDHLAALKIIEANREATRAIAPQIACLEAASYERLGDRTRGIAILEHAIAELPKNFWVFHGIAAMYRNAGRPEDCITVYRDAHEAAGWPESKRHGYIFTHDFFSGNIETWSKWFAEEITAAPIEALEIGSWQGGSTTWLLDKVIFPRGGRLTCVDTFEGSSEHAAWINKIGKRIEDVFDHNVAASGHANLCRKLVGRSQAVLRELYEERFDFIYIDGAHEARWVIEDAVLAYGLLKPGGYLLFDDYDYRFPHKPGQNTGIAVDAFATCFADEVSIIGKGRQFLLQKNLSTAFVGRDHPTKAASRVRGSIQNQGGSMSFDVITVADRARISLGAALNILVARKTCPEARFHIAMPEDSVFESAAAEEILTKYATSVFKIPAPSIHIEGKIYRIENKVNSVLHSRLKQAVFVDSDTILLRPLPTNYIFTAVPRAAPEHGLHEFPWDRLFGDIGLNSPEIKVLMAGGEVGSPWLNAGVIACPNAEALGSTWRMMCDYVLRCDWVPERYPYLDQIALPLAFAQLSPSRSVTFDNILPERFNQNLFYWAGDQSYSATGFVAHHHSRVKLIERYFEGLLSWTRDEYPVIDQVLGELRQFDRSTD